MKRWMLTFLSVVLILLLAVPVFATPSRLVDDADLLTTVEEEIITEKLNEVSQKWSMDVVIVTVDSTNGAASDAFADDYFDNNGYGFGPNHDGILLLISMEYRDLTISTTGRGITVFTDAGLDYLLDEVVLFLSDDDFYNGCMLFADHCDDFCRQASKGDPYNADHLPSDSFPLLLLAAISLVVGFLIGFIVTAVMKAQLKSVRSQPTANNYLKSGSLKITQSTDLFLYRNITRTPRPKQNSGGSSVRTSSSGRVHGGSSRKF